MGVEFFVEAIAHARSHSLATRIVTNRLNHLSDDDYNLCLQELGKRCK